MKNSFFAGFLSVIRKLPFTVLALLAVSLAGCDRQTDGTSIYLDRAKQTLDSLYANYSVEEKLLLRENYPFDEDYMATYLASEEQASMPNPYAFLWPFSGTFSAVSAIMESDGDYRRMLDSRVLPGLEEYYDTKRTPAGYASYIESTPPADRFYDDNVWIGIDFTDAYLQTGDERYLAKARQVWKFVDSGRDSLLGGGIYWCEQARTSKNTCSNAPGAVYALKLYKATGDAAYLGQGKALYEWTKKNLKDPADNLYFDNIGLDGRVDKAKYAYNSGQMLQAAALLYDITGEAAYLEDAKKTAASCHDYFFHDFTSPDGESFRLLNRGNIWFTAVMFRGFVELYGIDKDPKYMDDFRHSLDYAWDHARDRRGLFSQDWSGSAHDSTKWLLTQAAMAEMYARISKIY